MDYTFATVIIPAADRTKAKSLLGVDGVPSAHFDTACSASGELPATHYVSSGAFDNANLDKIVNQVDFEYTFHLEALAHEALALEGLKVIGGA